MVGVEPTILQYGSDVPGALLILYKVELRLIQDYLGHRDPKHTVHYTRVAGVRFEGMWGT